MRPVRKKLYPWDPYEGFDRERHPADLQGWGSKHQFFEPLLRFTRPETVIEVGSWKGASAIHMAGVCRAQGFDAEIVCVDTWLGSPENLLDRAKGGFASLRHQNGYPSLYYTFMANVVQAGFADRITPLPMASESAAVVLEKLSVEADLIYIDAAHEYEPALRDMKAFWPLLRPKGVMVMDDYGRAGVTAAACEFAASVGRPLYASYGKAFVPKAANTQVSLTLDRIEAV